MGPKAVVSSRVFGSVCRLAVDISNFAANTKEREAYGIERQSRSLFSRSTCHRSPPSEYLSSHTATDGRRRMKRGHESRRIILQASLFAACCLLAFWIRSVVAVDSLSDLATVSLEFVGFAIFIAAVGFAVLSAHRATGVAERAVLRIIPIGLVLAGAAFVKTSYADVSIALRALTAREVDAKTSIELGPTGVDVRLTGTLTEGAGGQLSALLARNPLVARIHLTSEGGLVDEGEALRKVVAAHHLTTFVPDYCVSACTLVLLGGRERLMMTGARIGFHAPFEEGLFGQVFQGDMVAERASYISAGVTREFTDKALAVASSDIWTPEAEVLVKANVVTGVVDRYRFPDSNLDGIATQAGARATVLRNFPAAEALDRWRPEDVDAIAASYLASYNKGLSEGEATDDLKEIVGAAAAAAIVEGDDETIVGYGRFLDKAMRAATSEADCTTIGTEADLVQAEEALDQGDGKVERLVMSLLTRALRSPREPAHAEPLGESATTTISAGRSVGTCATLRGLYEHALRLPQNEAAAIVRSLAWGRASLSVPSITHEN